jgi:hypothetical protein
MISEPAGYTRRQHPEIEQERIQGAIEETSEGTISKADPRGAVHAVSSSGRSEAALERQRVRVHQAAPAKIYTQGDAVLPITDTTHMSFLQKASISCCHPQRANHRNPACASTQL